MLICFSVSVGAAFAQNKQVQGKVVDDGGEPVIGASISVKGNASVGTSTDLDGRFNLSVPSSATTLLVKYLGMQDLEVAVASNVTVTLHPADNALEEVLVTVAYGQVKKRALTGAVSAISAEKIEQRPLSSISNVLEGIQGITVSNVYGAPGSDPDIRIRGFTTINGSNAPMWVIDGVPFSGNVSDINPQDIASISVLKDAASAALYGNRASNGVIMVTTKAGQASKPTVSVTMNQGYFERGIPEYERMGANDFMETMWLGYRNQLQTSANPSKFPTPELAGAEASNTLISNVLGYNIYNQPNTQLFDANGKLVAGAEIREGFRDDLDWFKPVIRNGQRQEYSVSMNGKTDKTSSYLSVGYLDEKGYITNSGFNRYTALGKMKFNPNKWLETGATLRGSYQLTDNTNGKADASYTNAFMFARNIAPIYPVHLHDMTTGAYVLDATTGNKIYDNGSLNGRKQYLDRHLIQEIGLNKDQTTRQTLEGNLYAQIKFLNDFTFKVGGNLNVRVSENDVYENAIIGDGKGNNGRAGFTDYRYKDYTAQELLYYDKVLKEKHEINLFAGHENTANTYWYSYGRKAEETFAGQADLINFSSITSLTGYEMNKRYESYLGSAKYNYSAKYYVDASFRRDGSSRFYKDKRWGNFYSLSGSWVVSSENFMQGIKDKITFLKFRTGYGEVGNDYTESYFPWMALYAVTTNAGQAALYKSQLEALDLMWESTSSFDVSLEGRLFDRVDFNVEYFDKRSHGTLFDVFLPLSAGSTTSSAAEATITQNLGANSNKGVEFGVNVEVFKNRDFQWNVGLDATAYKNNIETLPEQNRKDGIIDGSKKYLEGHGIYDFWLYQFAGVDQMSGRSLYKIDTEKYYVKDPSGAPAPATEKRTVIPVDAIGLPNTVNINGVDYTYKTTYAKRDYSGSAIPDVSGAFNTSFRYKDFSLNAQFTYALGNKILDYTYQSYMSVTANPRALHADLLKSWNGVPAGMTETSPNRIDPNGIPEVNYYRSADNNATSTRFLKDGSYLTLKVVNLVYTVPKKITDKLDITSARINLTAENLFISTKYKGVNPQQSFSGLQYNYLTTPRVLSLGLNVQF
ncbi:SusC/RagA family TonB-linked outer membrane protein [Bacteroidia bacterium]|nr:SusC/RagA family TonB-linked outer membrane protein [Bacteroidia bacterium]